MTLEQIGFLTLGVLFLIIVLALWINGDKFRESNKWVIAWLGYIFSIAGAYNTFMLTGLFS